MYVNSKLRLLFPFFEVVSVNSKLRLLFPFLSTVQTLNEDRHRFICRPRLHLPVPRLRLLALLTREHRGSLHLGPFQHQCLSLHVFIRRRLPVFRKEFPRRHEGYLMGWKLAILQPSQKTTVRHISSRIQVRDAAPRRSAIENRKVRILPVFTNALAVGIGQGCIVDSLLQIDPFSLREGSAKTFCESGGDFGS